jgi:hypothetical protein
MICAITMNVIELALMLMKTSDRSRKMRAYFARA